MPGRENRCLTTRGKYFGLLGSALCCSVEVFQISNHYREMISADAADLLPVHRQSFSCRSRMFLLPF